MLSKHGIPLSDLADWEMRAGPKKASQWKPGRSALEVARAWLASASTGMPSEILATLATNSAFGPVLRWEAEPEVRLAIDSRRGEPRNTDLLVIAHDAMGAYVIAVEAKADESFDREYAVVLAEALEARLANPRSGALERAVDLAKALLPAHRAGHPAVAGLRYQLFTAAVGALCEAERRDISRVVLMIHEFVTDVTTDSNHERNASDLDAWISRISDGAHTSVPSERLIGPIRVPGTPSTRGPGMLFVGKAVRRLRGSGV